MYRARKEWQKKNGAYGAIPYEGHGYNGANRVNGQKPTQSTMPNQPTDPNQPTQPIKPNKQ